jgi:HlyD family secretion protein
MKSKTDMSSDVAKTLQIDRRPVRRRRLVLWICAALIVVVTVVVAANRGGGDNSGTVRFQTQEVRNGDLTVLVTATGTLAAINSVDVGSELSGTVKVVEADYNDRVRKGQILARLDTSKLEAQTTQSRAALAAAKAKVLQSRATVKETRAKLAQYQKVRELSDNKVPSQAEFDAAEAALARAIADEASSVAAVDQAQATLDGNETELSKGVIHSPIDGIVITRSIEPGQTVAAAMQAPVLFTLAEDLKKMKLQVNVDEADVGRVRQEQRATFTVDAYPDRIFEARISQIRYGSSTVDGVVTYLTVLLVDNNDLSLRPGMTATAEIVVQRAEKAILVPAAALRFTPPVQVEKKQSGGLLSAILPHPPRSENGPPTQEASLAKRQQRVWILKDGKPAAIPVVIGSTDGTVVQVLSGEVKPGMALITDTTTVQ